MDPLEKMLRNLQSPKEANIYSEKSDKVKLILQVGPLTCKNIINAKKEFKLSRIPFLFSSIDSQLVVDVLNNDLDDELDEILDKK